MPNQCRYDVDRTRRSLQDKALRRIHRWFGNAAALAAGLGLLASTPVCAQTVDGLLVAKGRGIALAGAFIIASDSNGTDVQRVLTDSAGGFTLSLPGAGRYRLRTAMIGWESWTTPPLNLRAGERLRYRMEVPLHAVALRGIVIEADRRCRTNPDTGLAVTRVWQEARKALAAVAWSQRRVHTYRVERFERQLDARSLAILHEQRTPTGGASRGSPFVSQPAIVLSANGYIQPAGGDWDFFAPDADVLLSESFASDHCFFLTRDRERPQDLGLAFQPVRDRRVPDIQGVLWLDHETAALRELEYRYSQLPWPVAPGVSGGRVQFTQLPTGTWIVHHWSIRMPRVGLRATEHVVLAYTEVGGEVTEVLSAGGGPLRAQRPSRLAGSVFDSTTMSPLPDASVMLLGTTHAARTDSGGRFAFPHVPPGTYRITFEHARLDSLGFVPEPQEVAVMPGRGAAATLALPPRDHMRAQLCPESSGEDVAVIAGFVRWADSAEPVAGASVSATWEEIHTATRAAIAMAKARVDVVTDAEGYYLVCGVTPDRAISLRATYGDAQSTPGFLKPTAGQIARRDFRLPAPPRDKTRP